MKKMLSVSFFTALLTLLRIGAGFIVMKIVAVYTGPSGIALIGQVQNFATILNGAVSSPGSTAVVRYTAENADKGFEYCSPWWKASLRWILILLVPCAGLSIVFSAHISEILFERREFAWLVAIIGSLLPLSVIGTLVNSVINGQQQYRRYVALGMISVVVSTVIMLALVHFMGLNGAILAAGIQTALIGIIMLFSSIRQPWFKLKYWIGSVEREKKNAIAGYLTMTIVSVIAMPISIMALRWMIANQLGWAEAGQWQVVWKISEVYLSVITISLSTYYLPKLSSLINYDQIKKEINSTAFVVFPLVSILAICVYLSRDIVLSILFTSDFSSARNLFGIQLIGDVLKILSWLYAYPMISRGSTKWFISTEIFFSFSLIVLSWYLIRYFGLQGANYAYALNYLIYFIFVFLNLKRVVVKS
ncbi:O-antigen translocase [Erwinia aphidicola]|uniref:O-antigen translocase n=1 Tax=Erwinia aphidicola TaxID=68334 RepID=UPI00300C8F67